MLSQLIESVAVSVVTGASEGIGRQYAFAVSHYSNWDFYFFIFLNETTGTQC